MAGSRGEDAPESAGAFTLQMTIWRQEISTDCRDVLATSSVLSISEFELFRLAYVAWFGRETDDKTLEAHFVPYMFRSEVPCWVRAFTRNVLTLDRQGRLRPNEFGIEPASRAGRDRSRGLLYAVGIGLALVALFKFAEAAAPLMGVDGCWFPPCY